MSSAGAKRGDPPHSSRFRKGQSGNPKGRPRSKQHGRSPSGSAFDVILERRITVEDHGQTRELTVEEGLQQETLKAAFEGRHGAQRQILKMIEKREAFLAQRAAASRSGHSEPTEGLRVRMSHDPRNADEALKILGIAHPDPRMSRGDDTANPAIAERAQERALVLAHWAAQLALQRRRGGRKLTTDEINQIKWSTQHADDLIWPRGSKA